MKIEVNISKRYFFSILGLMLIVGAVIVVSAVWDNSKKMFHSSEDVKITIGGINYSLQEAIDSGLVGGGGHTQVKVFCAGEVVSLADFVCPSGWDKVGVIDNGGTHACWDSVLDDWSIKSDSDSVICLMNSA